MMRCPKCGSLGPFHQATIDKGGGLCAECIAAKIRTAQKSKCRCAACLKYSHERSLITSYYNRAREYLIRKKVVDRGDHPSLVAMATMVARDKIGGVPRCTGEAMRLLDKHYQDIDAFVRSERNRLRGLESLPED